MRKIILSVLIVLSYCSTGFSQDALENLVERLKSSDYASQRAAIAGLTQFGMEGFEAIIAALEDPDEGLRQELQGALREYENLFPLETGPMTMEDPLSATVDGGLVIGPSGDIPRPYKIRFTIEPKDDQFLCELTVNDLVVRKYDRSMDQEERLKQDGPRAVAQLAKSLSNGRFLFVAKPNHTTGGSARLLKPALQIIREAKRTDFERAAWLDGFLGIGARTDIVTAAMALEPNAEPEAIDKLARQLEHERPTFRLSSDDKRGVYCEAFNVSPEYCLDKFESYFHIKIEGSREGLRTPRIRVGEWMPKEAFLNRFAEHVGATLAKEGDIFRITALPTPQLRDPATWDVAWRQVSERPFLRTPAVADGKAIAMVKHGYLTAFSLEDGKKVWETQVAYIPETPTVVNDVLFTVGGDNDMYAVRVADGNLLWKHQAETPTEGDVRINHHVRFLGLHKATAIFSSSDGNVYALDAATGARVWTYKPEFDWASAGTAGAACLEGEVLFIAGENASCAVSADTQRVLWMEKSAKPRPACIAVNNGKFFALGEGVIMCLTADEGKLLWQCDTERKGLGYLPAFAEDRMFITGGRTDNFVYCLDTQTGEIIWKTNVPGRPIDCALRGDELAVVSEGLLYALDAAAGQIVEKRSFGREQIQYPPTSADPLLLICTQDPEAGGQYGHGILTAYHAAHK